MKDQNNYVFQYFFQNLFNLMTEKVMIAIFCCLINSFFAIETVGRLNLEFYLGNWFPIHLSIRYEVATSLSVRLKIDKDAFC